MSNDLGLVNLNTSPITEQKDAPVRTMKEIVHQDNIFEIEMHIESDIEGGIDINHDCIYGHLLFL